MNNIIQNTRGGWSFVVKGRQIGNYGTKRDALRAFLLTGEKAS